MEQKIGETVIYAMPGGTLYYHGTNKKDAESILKNGWKTKNLMAGGIPTRARGNFFCKDKKEAARYTSVDPVLIVVKFKKRTGWKPIRDLEELWNFKNTNETGLIIPNTLDTKVPEYVVFNPNRDVEILRVEE